MEKFEVWLESRNHGTLLDGLVADFAAFNRETREKDAELRRAGVSQEERRAAYEAIMAKYTGKPVNKAMIGAAAGGLAAVIVLAPVAAATFVGLGLIALALLNSRASFGDESAEDAAAELKKEIDAAKDAADDAGAKETVDKAEAQAKEVQKEIDAVDNGPLKKLLAGGSSFNIGDKIQLLAAAAAISKNREEPMEKELESLSLLAKDAFQESSLGGLRGKSSTVIAAVSASINALAAAGIIDAKAKADAEANLNYRQDNAGEAAKPAAATNPATAGASPIEPGVRSAAEAIWKADTASINSLQRSLGVGMAKAQRMLDTLEKLGVVGPYRPRKSREILVRSWEELSRRQKTDAPKTPEGPPAGAEKPSVQGPVRSTDARDSEDASDSPWPDDLFDGVETGGGDTVAVRERIGTSLPDAAPATDPPVQTTPPAIDGESETETDPISESDVRAAAEVIWEADRASTSLVQRRLKVGFARAGQLMDALEGLGVVGPYNGSKPRNILARSWEELSRQKPAGERVVTAASSEERPDAAPQTLTGKDAVKARAKEMALAKINSLRKKDALS